MTCNPRHRPVPFPWERGTLDESIAAANRFQKAMSSRRSIRDFSADLVPYELIRTAVSTAAAAPSGANIQPWRFVVVADPELKRRIREGAEEEERAFYGSKASDEWLAALEPLGTDWRKPFLEMAPFVIVVFEVHMGAGEPKPYYPKESVGIAVGFLLAALHQAGLATLTHTPSPMRFLNAILDRPPNERAFVVIPVGWPADNVQVPLLERKPLEEVLIERLAPEN